MKNRILTVSFVLLSAQLFSQTIIENNINANTTWSQDGNPYIVNQTITVSNNITLSIEPGVIIKLNGTGKLFIVNGSINASGTSENPIIITHITDDEYGGDSNGDGSQTAAKINSWASIQINETSENSSHLNHCVFRFGGRVQGVVYADNCSPAINNCLFQYCENGIEINGFGSPSVKNNQFKNIENYPVAITPGVIPQFEGNTFSDNILTGLGLKKNTHTTDGDSLILSKTSIGGIKNATYIVQTPIAIDENTSLTIHPGIVIKKYYNNNLFQVNGSLIAEGIAEEPIVFTFITDDEFGGDTNNDANNTIPKKDSWASIQINETSENSSHLNHCVFRYGGRTNGSIYVQNSSPKIQNCYFKLCKNGLKIVNGNQLNISNLDFTDSETAIQLQNESEFVNIEKSKFSNNLLALEVISGLAKVDSCFFYKNENAIKVMGGNAIIHHSEFVENSKYHILNYTDKGIDATKNQWDENTIQELISSSNLTNVKQLYDHFDNAQYGTVDYSGYLIPDNKIFIVSPSVGLVANDTISVTITANPVNPYSKVIFYNHSNGVWNPESSLYIDSLRIKTMWDKTKAVNGRYDVIIINGNDSLVKKDGFVLVEGQIPFGEWVKFEVANDTLYTSSVFIPPAENIYCLLKKTTHIGYSSSWRGQITLFDRFKQVVKNEKFAEDIMIHLNNEKGGYYTFDISSHTKDYWDGYIKFCIDPDTLEVNEWNNGEILRPFGSDWKVFELNNDAQELIVQTEGYGKWSNITVYYDYIGNMEEQWYFQNSGQGYNIEGSVQNAKKGKYYIKYIDSAVLRNGSVNSKDQSRSYLVYVGTSGAPDTLTQEILLNSVSSHSFGRNVATIELSGKGLNESTKVFLIQGNDTIFHKIVNYNIETTKLEVQFDFSKVNTGDYQLVLKNENSSYTYENNILITEEIWKPIGIQIIGNEKYRVGRYQTVIVKITNQSNTNIKNGYAFVEFDNKNLSISFHNDIYTSELNDTLNYWYSRLNILRENFFFSNLAPGEDVYIKMKMFSENPNMGPSTLMVTSGVLNDDLYNKVFSVITDISRETLNKLPIKQSVKNNLNALTESEWNDITDISMDYLLLNRFNYNMGELNLKSYSSTAETHKPPSRTGKVRTATRVMLTTFGAATGGKEGAVQSATSGSLPLGVGTATGPVSMVGAGLDAIFNISDGIDAGMRGYEGGNDSDDKKNQPSRELSDFSAVGSSTPEDKFGPIGASVDINDSLSNHYIGNIDEFEYRIDYWNKEDATAPAAIVYIRDTLDADFDLETFSFTEVGFMKWKAELDGGQYFDINIDTRPEMPYIVNIKGTIDPSSREAYWIHTTLDPETMQLTADPEGGYLPPIDSSGYQVGWVGYTVNSKPGLPDGTVYTNQAFVNFDGVGRWGPAPKEGPFTNVFDASVPVSSIIEGSLSAADSVLVKWSGNDVGSGIQSYDIYVSDGGNYYLWKTAINDTSAWFKGENGKTYHFFSIVRDRVGNTEAGNKTAEHSITFGYTDIDQISSADDEIELFPNPTSGILNIKKYIIDGESYVIEIYDLSGTKVFSKVFDKPVEQIDLKHLAKGIYVVKTKLKNRTNSNKLIVN